MAQNIPWVFTKLTVHCSHYYTGKCDILCDETELEQTNDCIVTRWFFSAFVKSHVLQLRFGHLQCLLCHWQTSFKENINLTPQTDVISGGIA